MSYLFQNQSFGRTIYKHKELPLYLTDEFVFFRCVAFQKDFYGKTVSDLHSANLRATTVENRYSQLFPCQRISYWSDSPQTSRAEVKYHDSGNNLVTFWAYDDATSTFPTSDNKEALMIIDGREWEFNKILQKVESGDSLTKGEQFLINKINLQHPDCLAYTSLRSKKGMNFLFFEKGFYKLSIREVRLHLGDYKSKNSTRIICADTSDYAPYPKSYGMYFAPIAKTGMDTTYLETQEYKKRNRRYK